jgi:hypothetical protein
LRYNRYNAKALFADILRYSISQDQIEKVSSLSTATEGGLAHLANDGKSIYYFGGHSNLTTVHKFDSETNLTLRLPTELPSPVYYAAAVSINGTILIFNGHQRNILEFSETLETAVIIGDLPFQSGDSTVLSTTAIPNGNDGVWLFAGTNPKPTNPVLLFNTVNKLVYIPTENLASLPTLFFQPASVWEGRQGFLIGGLGRVPEIDGSYHLTNGILT